MDLFHVRSKTTPKVVCQVVLVYTHVFIKIWKVYFNIHGLTEIKINILHVTSVTILYIRPLATRQDIYIVVRKNSTGSYSNPNFNHIWCKK